MNLLEHYTMIAMEECAEIAQRLSKAGRFGMRQVQMDADDEPQQNPGLLDNRDRIRQELGDLLGTLDLLGVIKLSTIFDRDLLYFAQKKQDKVKKYLERSRREGTLTEEA